jgi:hypothetical protein
MSIGACRRLIAGLVRIARLSPLPLPLEAHEKSPPPLAHRPPTTLDLVGGRRRIAELEAEWALSGRANCRS